MDISILLALQNLRQSLGGVFEGLFVGISFIADGPLLVAIAFVVYWAVDKRTAQFAFTSFALGNFVSQFLKNLFCVYRPWIRDASIQPAAGAIEGAGGYSFPSGHTTGATTVFGSFALQYRDRHRILSVVCLVLIVLIAFSRNFLGVHTPQDVLVGFLVAILAIWATIQLFRWIEDNPDRDVFVVVAVLVISVISLAIVMLKPYPMDYGSDGALLVDPVQMQKGSFEAAGIAIGFAVGWLLERRMVNFSTDGLDLRTRLVHAVFGIACVGVTYLLTSFLFKLFLPITWAKLVSMILVVFVATFVVPFLFGWADSLVERFLPQAAPAPAPSSRSRRTRSGDVDRYEEEARSRRASRPYGDDADSRYEPSYRAARSGTRSRASSSSSYREDRYDDRRADRYGGRSGGRAGDWVDDYYDNRYEEERSMRSHESYRDDYEEWSERGRR